MKQKDSFQYPFRRALPERIIIFLNVKTVKFSVVNSHPQPHLLILQCDLIEIYNSDSQKQLKSSWNQFMQIVYSLVQASEVIPIFMFTEASSQEVLNHFCSLYGSNICFVSVLPFH